MEVIYYMVACLSSYILVEAIPFGGAQKFVPLPASCCFNDTIVSHGETVFSLPQKCLQLVCSDGDIKPHFLGQPGALDCCEFAGLLYPSGSELSAQCLSLKCHHGRWTPSSAIDDCCRHCCLHDDPHIYSFDGHQYDWHGTCNYSVAQTDLTHSPETGVFSDFEPCNGRASCLAHTTFRDNPHTVITLDSRDVFTMLVNGDLYFVPEEGVQAVRSSSGEQPVLSWRNGQCIMLLGSSRLMLQHCRHRLDVWAHPSHADNLDGLCGHYNFYGDDDFTDREGDVHPLEYFPLVFPQSWLTSEQKEYSCYDQCPECKRNVVMNPCHASEEQMEDYRSQCEHFFQSVIAGNEELQNHIRTCQFDLCMMYQDGRSHGDVREWLALLLVNVKISKTIVELKLQTTKIDIPKNLIDIKLESCDCKVTLQPELTSLDERLPRLLKALKELHHAVEKFGPLETVTIVKPRGVVGFFKEIMGTAKKILGDLLSALNEGRSHLGSCPVRPIKAASLDLQEVIAKVLEIRATLKEDDPTVQEIRLDVEETIDTVGSALGVVTEIKVKLDSTPCH